MFKYKTEVSKLPEVKVFTPDPYPDYRGTMWTHWESDMNTPPHKISKFTHSRKNVLRGLHFQKLFLIFSICYIHLNNK